VQNPLQPLSVSSYKALFVNCEKSLSFLLGLKEKQDQELQKKKDCNVIQLHEE